ncbi:ABC transporter permease [Paenibacillus mucilaginosus]|uniref:Binding-protein-dependent transport systems inner membrane component n=2 Tax=Paenibacillus mucilaginosus TaxID=61624 RepID=H6NI00_9BACL|nr:ABC transporter permease subunit [Paenibacillus mucilaginosus]AEI43093.1 binding-protein-dependent transport systems inner membrane component [Paenibacillus mucilaginosus KNP414]AFC30771.1 binding-protein-dependent transport systems inner membrane component [Paenibacillus mucilaginosus 3016]MCG7212332.1 ABC transporter permease subunit [Paenibacillus mucilaginosus]WDM24710.1 sugar ABC transporter permease [Paenibacillus mucilaginosus]WFA19378.1 sugar ABC transporter permease [Paenibacillus 
MELKHQLPAKAEVLKTSRVKFYKKEILRNKYVYLMLLPVILYYLIFHYGPMYGLLMAFQKTYSPVKGILAGTWIGFDNFKMFFESYYFWRLIKNTLILSFFSIVLGFPAPIILALLLNEVRVKWFKSTVQTVSYLPHFISVVVVVGMLKSFSALDGGLFNVFRSLFALEPVMFLAEKDMFRPLYILSNIWQGAGWGSIIFLAALAGIDSQLYEAAKIDGAGRWKQLLHITIPGIMPTVVVLLILRLGAVMNADFQKILLMQTAPTYETSDVISTFVYRSGILEGNYTYSTAIGLFNGVINFGLLILANTISRKLNSSSLW